MTRYGWFLLFLTPSWALGAALEVDLVVGAAAPPLEKTAAAEVAAHLKRIYQAETRLTDQLRTDATQVILIGSPRTNPHMSRWAQSWPQLSEQGHCLRTVVWNDRPALLVGGGSPAATLWAAAEFAHRLGVRPLLFGDLDPVEPSQLTLAGYDVVLEPSIRVRAWRCDYDSPAGFASWGSADQQQFIRQLAQLKYNRLVLAVRPWQPFVDFEVNGVRKQSAELWSVGTLPVDGDTAGRRVFAGAKRFENPEFAGRETYAERLVAGQKLLASLIETAHAWGMTVGLRLAPLEFPAEFRMALPEGAVEGERTSATIVPGPGLLPNDDGWRLAVAAQLRAYANAYPQLDAFYLSVRGARGGSRHGEAAWQLLSQGDASAGLPPSQKLLRTARGGDRTDGDASEKELQGDLVALAVLRGAGRDSAWRARPDGGRREVWLADVHESLVPYLAQILPDSTGLVATSPGTPSPKGVPRLLAMDLGQTGAGLLPQTSHSQLLARLRQLSEAGGEGFEVSGRFVGDVDLGAYLLGRGAFEREWTVADAARSLLTPVSGEEVSDRVLKALDLIEHAAATLGEHDPSLGQAAPDMVVKHLQRAEAPPDWWQSARDDYLNAMNEMYRANTRARAGGRALTLYLARRAEFGFVYLSALESVRKAAAAKQGGDSELQLTSLETAVDGMNDALSALAAVTRSNTDRGIIAVLNQYGYRPLVRELEALDQ
ncbi:MAG: hypothetical protein AB7F89_00355 [Pirellulaceae bacterium]